MKIFVVQGTSGGDYECQANVWSVKAFKDKNKADAFVTRASELALHQVVDYLQAEVRNDISRFGKDRRTELDPYLVFDRDGIQYFVEETDLEE